MWSRTETILLKWVTTKVWNPKHQSSQTSRVQHAREDALTNKRPTWCGYVTRLKRLPKVSETWNKNENSQEKNYGQDQNNELWMTSHGRKEKHERKLRMILWKRETDEEDWLLDNAHKEKYIKLTFILDRCNLNLWKYKTGAARLTLHNVVHTIINLLLPIRHNNHFPRL